jgi:peptide/nickel transport system substrate-binding protein
MSRHIDLEAMLRNASPTTRRDVLKKMGTTGLAAPALLAMLRAAGVQDVEAAPGSKWSGANTAAQDATPVPGGTLVVTGHQEIASLSPDDAGPTVHFVVVTQIHDPLIQGDENFVFQPILAETMPEISADGLKYTFKIRQGVKFHDGVELTSEDVKYTYEWTMNPENAAINATYFASVDSVEAPDPYTVIVNLKHPNAAFFAQVANRFIVPAKYHASIGEAEYKAKPIGTGPFKLKEWRAAEFTELEANPDYFRGAPYLAGFREEIVPEASVRAIGLETGEAHSAVWPLSPEDNVRLSEDPNFKVYVTSSLAVNHFPLNNTHPVLSDKSVRQAMMYAIDRQTVVDEIFVGTAQVATANLSPALAEFYNAEVPTYPYDPAKAAELLDAAGWVLNGDTREKNGQKLAFTITTITGDQTRRPEAELVQQYLNEAGFAVELQEAPVATILEKLRAGEMDASLFNWTYGGDDADPDATSTLRSDGTSNFSQWSNPRVDELLDLGLTEIDPVKRAEHYKEIQAIVAEEVPFIFMMFWNWYNIFSTKVKGLPETALSGDSIYTKAYRMWLEES